MRHFLIFLYILLLGACGSSERSGSGQAKAFFDLGEFFGQEARRLQSLSPRVQKTVRIDSSSESKTLSIKDWEGELAFFSRSNINKPAWWDRYRVDSLFDDAGKLLELRYEALRPELRTRKLDIKFDAALNVHSIVIVNRIDNSVSEGQEFLEYIPNQSYTITKKQHVVLHQPGEYHIKALFEGS